MEGAKESKTRTYNIALRHEVNWLSRMLYGTDVDEYYRDPGRYTGWYENYLRYAVGKKNETMGTHLCYYKVLLTWIAKLDVPYFICVFHVN